MRQLVQDLRSGELQVIEGPDPIPHGNEVLVRTTWSLISAGTERAVASAASRSLVGKARERPDLARKVIEKARREGVRAAASAVRARLDDFLTPGYSSAGIVEALGPQASGVAIGDRVACIGANLACHAERVIVPAPLCFRLPGELDDRFGAFGAIGAIAAHGVRVAEVVAGSTVAVVGLGLVGQLTTQLVSAAGAQAVGSDLDDTRIELARRLGAVAGARPEGDELERLVLERTEGHGADAVILTAAGKDSGPLELAARIARDRGIVVAVGDIPLSIPRRPFYEKELQLRLSRSYGPGRYDPEYEHQGRDYPIGYVRWTERRLVRYFLDQAALGRVRLGELITHEFPIERALEAYEALSDPSRLAVMLRYAAEPKPLRRVPTRAKGVGKPGRLRVGLIGPGTFARSTLLPLLRSLDVELAAVAGRSPARAVGVARRSGAAFAAADAEEILADESIDVVVVATRHDSHATLAAEALERGKSVFLEKPLAIDEKGLRRMEPLLESGGRLVVDFNRALAPATRQVTSHFAPVGEPVFINYRVNAGFVEPDHWIRDPDVGGGRLVGEACHFVDFCSALAGSRVLSLQVVGLGDGPSTLEHDNFVLTLRYTDGSVASISYLATGNAELSKERIEVMGGRRAAVVEDFRRVMLLPTGRLAYRPRPRRQDKGHAAFLKASFDFFRDGGNPPIPYDRLLETTRTTLVAREALSRGDRSSIMLEPQS